MPRIRITLAFLAATLSSLPVLAFSESRVESFIISDGKHPAAYQHAFVVPQDSAGDVYACMGYGTDGKNADTGSFRGTVRISRLDPDTGEVAVQKLRKRGSLSKNKWLRCVHAGPVRQGDTVVWEYQFLGFPRPRGAAIHIRSSIGTDRMLISKIRGPEATGSLGEPTEVHHRVRTNATGAGKHPKTWQQAFVVAATHVAERVELCFGYGNDFKKDGTGSFRATAEITRTDPDTGEVTVQRIKGEDDLTENKAKSCRDIDRVRLGDTLVVDWEFFGFPRIRDDIWQTKIGIGPRVMANREIYGPAPPPPAPPAPGPGGGPGPDDDPFPNPGGNISAADQIAVSSLMYKSVRTQLWRFKGNQPERWTVIGPKTQLGTGLGGVNPNTTGYGATIAAAVADYERKMGKLPAGSGISASDVSSLEWYQKMNTAGGPTSIRRDGGGGFHGEYYRPGPGSVVIGGFGGITAVVNWFKSQGL